MSQESFGKWLQHYAGRSSKYRVYLDWNSTSPMHPEVISTMSWVAERIWANPSSVHSLGQISKSLVESVRQQIAENVGARSTDIAFTSGGTEANNWALAEAPGLALSLLEHPSVSRQADRMRAMNRPVRWLPVLPNGKVNVDALPSCIVDLPIGSRVAVMAVNHETGVIQPLNDIAKIAHAHGCWLHVDAVQALGKLELEHWQCWDTLSLGAHKIRGPKAIGALAWRPNVPVPKSIFLGGSQERGLRPGTVDPVLVAGFGQSLRLVTDGPARFRNIARLRDHLEDSLRAVAKPNVPNDGQRLGHVSSLSFARSSAAELVAAMDLEGVCISSGSACAAGTAEASPVISAMLGTETALSTVRVSMGETTTEDDIQQAIQAFRVVGERP